MITLIFAILLVIIGGFLNGSFPLPSKFITSISINKVWLYFSLWAYIIIPILTLWVFNNNYYLYYSKIPIHVLIAAFTGGIVWGIGMVFCLIALKHVGMSVTFGINIGLGTAGGSILPLIILHSDKLSSLFGTIIIFGFIIFILGVILTTIAAKIRDKDIGLKSINKNGLNLAIGLCAAVLAGLGSMTQAFSFTYSVDFFQSSIDLSQLSLLTKSNMPWVIIFFGAFISNLLYFSYALIKEKANHEKHIYSFKEKCKTHFLIVLMAIMFFECIIFFGFSAAILGKLGPMISYPIFMIFIILSSNFWGFYFGEWKHSSYKAKGIMILAIIFLIFAVLLQTISYNFTS